MKRDLARTLDEFAVALQPFAIAYHMNKDNPGGVLMPKQDLEKAAALCEGYFKEDKL